MAKKITIKPAVDLRKAQISEALDKWVNQDSSKMDISSMTRLNVNIPSELHKKIKAYCAQKGIKITDVINDLLEKEFGNL